MPTKPIRYLMFGLLYFAQGSIMGYFTSLNALYLQGYQLNMAQIGTIGTIAMTPFVLKIFLGMISDKFILFNMGHRKPYIILGLLLQSLTCFLVPLINPASQYVWFAIFAFIMMSAMALYDTCTDGLALDTTPKDEEGTIQGFMVGGRALGVVIVSGLIGVIAQNISWNAVFWMLGIIPLVPLLIMIRFKEEPRKAEHAFEWSAFSAFRNKNVIMLGLLGAVYSLIIYGANQNVNPFLSTTYHISLTTAGLMSMVWGIGVMIGGIAGGKLTDKIGQKHAVQVAIFASIVAIFCLALITSVNLAWILVFSFGLAFGYYETIFFAISMNLCNPKIAASMFSLLMAVANIGTAVGLSLSGALSVGIGYRYTFVLFALLNLVALPMLPAIFPKKQIVEQINSMKSICFDWGNTLMVDLPQYDGPMKDWPHVECVLGVAEALEQLSQKYKLYVATNAAASSAEDVRKALERVGISKFFTAIYTRQELKAEKPSLKFFYTLVKKIGDPSLCFVGDDYQKDILGAVNAGLTTIWFNPTFDHAPAHLPLHDAEFSHFEHLPTLFANPLLPNMLTCQHLLLEQPTGHGLHMHTHTVSAIAYQLALWCNENGKRVDPILVQRAAFLHDIGKLIQDNECQHHGEIGAKILQQKGFPQLASIIEKHPLLCLGDEKQSPKTTPEKLVYLADKYVEGCRMIPLEERLTHLAVRYQNQEQQIREILKELLQLQNECCDWMGFTPNEILYQLQQALK